MLTPPGEGRLDLPCEQVPQQSPAARMDCLKKYAIKTNAHFSHAGKKTRPAIKEYVTKTFTIGRTFALGNQFQRLNTCAKGSAPFQHLNKF
jgi:hypothetical protein